MLMEVQSSNSSHRFARTLVIFGGILGCMISLLSLGMVPFMAHFLGYGYGVLWQYGGMMMGKYYLFGYPRFGLDIMPTVMALSSLLGLAGGSLSVYCGLRLKRANRNMAFVSAIGGVLLLYFSWLPSMIVLAGALLLYFE